MTAATSRGRELRRTFSLVVHCERAFRVAGLQAELIAQLVLRISRNVATIPDAHMPHFDRTSEHDPVDEARD